MKLRRKLRDRLATLEAFSAHRREQLRQYGEVVEDLQTTCRVLTKRVEQLEASEHGHCRGCGAPTDFPTITACQKLTCTKDSA